MRFSILAPTLEEICRCAVLKVVKMEEIDDLNIPRILKRYLKGETY